MFFHLAWINTPREQGGLGNIQIPLLSDLTHQISKDYGVYLQDVGHALRYDSHQNLFLKFISAYLEDYLLLMVVVFFDKLQ